MRILTEIYFRELLVMLYYTMNVKCLKCIWLLITVFSCLKIKHISRENSLCTTIAIRVIYSFSSAPLNICTKHDNFYIATSLWNEHSENSQEPLKYSACAGSERQRTAMRKHTYVNRHLFPHPYLPSCTLLTQEVKLRLEFIKACFKNLNRGKIQHAYQQNRHETAIGDH